MMRGLRGCLLATICLSVVQAGVAIDPADDDWDAEKFVGPAARQLDRLGAWIAASPRGDLPDVFTRDARCSSLTADAETRDHTAFRASVDRQAATATELKPADALRRWAATMGDHANSISFKSISFARTAPLSALTTMRVEVSSRAAAELAYQVADWEVEWRLDGSESAPRIHRIRKLKSDRVTAKKVVFLDKSDAVLGSLGADSTLALGAEYWYGRIDSLGEPNLMGHQGIAVGDVNGDGLEDVYVAMGTGLPNRLLIGRQDGTVRDTADGAGVAWLDDTKGVLIVDTDNDGDRDIAAAIGNTIVLAKNDGSGKFEDFVRMKAPSSAPFYSLSAADFDLDGDLDLYGVRYVEQSYGVSVPVPFHDANNGPSNHLMRNDGDDRFVDVTVAVGLDENNRRFSLVGAWADYDLDGDPDLYVANDFGRNNLYRNDGGRFIDVAASSGTEDQAAGMGADWADYDADGDFDLVVTNMYSAAGRRVAYQPRFQPQLESAQRQALQRHSLGNSLFVNNGAGFDDRSDEAGVRMGRWGWGTIFLDWDNDAQEDLLVPNGFVTGALEDDL